jgi:hypothetical protein
MGQTPLGTIFARLAAGGLLPTLQGQSQDLFVGQRHAPLYESAYAGGQFVGANQAGVTTTVGLATTYVGLCLSNPNASKVNLVVERASGIFDVAFTSLNGIGLMAGFDAAADVTHATALTPRSALIGSTATSAAKLDSSATLPLAPTWVKWFKESPPATNGADFDIDLQGGIIIPPGGFIAIGTLAAGPASGFFGSFQWEEVPV